MAGGKRKKAQPRPANPPPPQPQVVPPSPPSAVAESPSVRSASVKGRSSSQEQQQQQQHNASITVHPADSYPDAELEPKLPRHNAISSKEDEKPPAIERETVVTSTVETDTDVTSETSESSSETSSSSEAGSDSLHSVPQIDRLPVESLTDSDADSSLENDSVEASDEEDVEPYQQRVSEESPESDDDNSEDDLDAEDEDEDEGAENEELQVVDEEEEVSEDEHEDDEDEEEDIEDDDDDEEQEDNEEDDEDEVEDSVDNNSFGECAPPEIFSDHLDASSTSQQQHDDGDVSGIDEITEKSHQEYREQVVSMNLGSRLSKVDLRSESIATASAKGAANSSLDALNEASSEDDDSIENSIENSVENVGHGVDQFDNLENSSIVKVESFDGGVISLSQFESSSVVSTLSSRLSSKNAVGEPEIVQNASEEEQDGKGDESSSVVLASVSGNEIGLLTEQNADFPARDYLPYLNAESWNSILFHLTDDKDYVVLANLCKGLRSLLLNPSIVANWLLKRSTHYLVLFDTYRTYSRLMTPNVIQTLISQGAHIPRYLTALIAREHPNVIVGEVSNLPKAFSGAIELIVWTGKSIYGDMFGFDAETAVNATLAPGQEAPEVINAKIAQYRRVLGWVYDSVVEERAKENDVSNDDFVNITAIRRTITDGDAFLHLLKLYKQTFVGDEVVLPDTSSKGKLIPVEQRKTMITKISLSEQEKERNRISAAVRELSNIYRFVPGLVWELLESQWLPVDLFERDVELAWFLFRHAGPAKDKVAPEPGGKDELAYRTLLGYRVHTSTSATSPGHIDTVSFASINKLIALRYISLTDDVLARLLRKFTNQTTVDRLLRFVPSSRLQQLGEGLLTECFEKEMLEKALSSGYISKPIQQAEMLVKIFILDKDSIARAFMGPPRDWDNWAPPPAPQATCTHVQSPPLNKAEGLFQLDLGMLTRQAQACGGLPWVSWQWVIQHLGPHHPVASACLHDCAVRSFKDQAPLNPGDPDAISFPRKEADASVKAMLALGVRTSLATVSTSIRKALYEIEVATLSGEAAAVMRTQAAALKGKKGKIAAGVAAAASLAGANAISRRYIYIMMGIEKRLLSTGSDEALPGTSSSNSPKLSDAKSVLSSGEASKSSKSLNQPSALANSVYDPFLSVEIEVSTDETSTPMKKRVPLYPQAILGQPRALWLAAMKSLVSENDTWKDLNNSSVAPNACRRFYLAVSNIVRGLEQFGMPASALAVLRSRKGSSKAVKSMSSNDSDNTMFFGLWCKEIEEEEAKKLRGTS